MTPTCPTCMKLRNPKKWLLAMVAQDLPDGEHQCACGKNFTVKRTK